MNTKISQIPYKNNDFKFLLTFRWLSVFPAFWLIVQKQITPGDQILLASVNLILVGVILYNLVISLFYKKLNIILLRFPAFLGIDLLITSYLIYLSGGSYSPYYLYAVSPLLVSAFFFNLPGAAYAALAFTPLYIAAMVFNQEFTENFIDTDDVLLKIAGIWLIPLLFGYVSSLISQLRKTQSEMADQNEELEISHRQLKIVHDLAILIQAAPDIQSVLRQVLEGVTTDMGYPRAIAALVDPVSEHLGNWHAYPPLPKPIQNLPALPLNPHDGQLFSSLFQRKTTWLQKNAPITSNNTINEWLGKNTWLSIPLIMQDHMVGVLLVEAAEGLYSMSERRLQTLQSVANHAAVSLGTTLLCIDRARNLAIEQERNRFARDIHDTVSQSLFGMAFTLDACVDMLPENENNVKEELLNLRELANSTRKEIRNSILDIWPSQLTLDRFKTDLTSYTNQCCRPREFNIDFDTQGDIAHLPNGIRRSLYRVAQEALSNASRHSGSSSANVNLNVEADKIFMSISDHGKGFDSNEVMSRENNRERFGLHGIQERISAIGGDVKINTREGGGTEIIINVDLDSKTMHNGQ
ncbi:MAG: GAF domain-containing sensor histidine kinase [Chloroflexota bacterium]